MSKEYKPKEKVIVLRGFPYSTGEVVEIIEKRKDRPHHYYIRKVGGGTDTYNDSHIMTIPEGLTVDLSAWEREGKQ
jgi:hypothetical protein